MADARTDANRSIGEELGRGWLVSTRRKVLWGQAVPTPIALPFMENLDTRNVADLNRTLISER